MQGLESLGVNATNNVGAVKLECHTSLQNQSRDARGFESLHLCQISPYRLMVRTPAFHDGNLGSNPGRDTKSAAVAQLDRASVYETEGQEFESLQPRQVTKKAPYGAFLLFLLCDLFQWKGNSCTVYTITSPNRDMIENCNTAPKITWNLVTCYCCRKFLHITVCCCPV